MGRENKSFKTSLAAGGIVLLLLFGMIGPIGAKKADAFPVFVYGSNPIATYFISNPPGGSFQSMDWIKEWILKPAARIIVRSLLQATTQQIINWIQGNGGKNVGYVSNLEAAMRREADVAAGEFLSSLANVNLCGNISAYLQLALRLPSFGQRFACSLTDIVANVNNFYQDFQKGGWPAFFRIALEPQNNVYGAYLIALDTKVGVEDNAQKFKGLALQKSYPFEGFKVPHKVCETIPPGQSASEQTAPTGVQAGGEFIGINPPKNGNKIASSKNLSGFAAVSLPASGSNNSTNNLTNLSTDELYQRFQDLNNSQDSANKLYHDTGDISGVAQIEQQRISIQDEIRARYPNLAPVAATEDPAQQEAQTIEQTSPASGLDEAAAADTGLTFAQQPGTISDEEALRLGKLMNVENMTVSTTEHGMVQACHTEYDTKTPGQLIYDQFSKAVGSGLDFAISAKDFDEAIAAIINALINRVITATFSSGSEGSASYGQGIFDTGLSNLPSENLNQNILVQQVNNGIYSADAALSAVDAKLINTRRELFDFQRQLADLLSQNPNPESGSAQAAQISDLEQKIKADQDAANTAFNQKTEILSDQYQLISLRNAFANITSATNVQALAQQLPQIMVDLGNITQNMENVPLPTISIGNPKRDTLELLRGSEGSIRRSMTLLDDTLAEIDRLATSTSSSASQWQQLLLRRPAVLTQKAILQTSLDKILQSQLDTARASDSEMNGVIINVLNQMQTVNQRLSDTASFIANVDGLRRSIWSTVFIISF